MKNKNRMNNEIEKSEQPNPDEVLTAIQSFNDPSIITNMFKELGWSYSIEIRETLTMAKQNANLSIKFKAIKHLRELLREAAESAGYTANVSQTVPNAHGGQTTFSAKRISGILNPTKQIESTEIKESQNDRIQEIKPEPDRGSNRQESQDDKGHSEDDKFGTIQEGISNGTDTAEQFPPERDTGRADTVRDVVPGGPKSPDGGEIPEQRPRATDDNRGDKYENPCIQTRPPTCNQDLYPGISTPAGES